MRTTFDNDNLPILARYPAVAAARLASDDKPEDENTKRQRRRERTQEEKADDHAKYVLHRLKEIQRWEYGLGIDRNKGRPPKGGPKLAKRE